MKNQIRVSRNTGMETCAKNFVAFKAANEPVDPIAWHGVSLRESGWGPLSSKTAADYNPSDFG